MTSMETRTSGLWNSQPGRLDVLNLAEVFATSSRYGIPDLASSQFVPSGLAAWHLPRQRAHAAASGGAVHTFLDDYRFESCWSSPARLLPRVQAVGAALSPDFSVWADMPRATQIFNIYRSRWVGAFWRANGVEVVPTVTWGRSDSFDFAFDGLPSGSVVAVSSMGVRRDAAELFAAGMTELISRCRPSTILAYGRLRWCDGLDLPEVVEYETHWDGRRSERKRAASTEGG